LISYNSRVQKRKEKNPDPRDALIGIETGEIKRSIVAIDRAA